MAVTAKFIADFSNFTAAVNGAEIQLRGFESNANKVGSALNRMTDQFSGRKIIQEGQMMARVLGDAGSIARLTGNELQVAGAKAAEAAEKMKRMGVDVPPGLTRIADAAKQAAAATRAAGDASKGASSSMSLLTTGLGAMAGAFTVTKILGFAANIVTAAGALQDLHERTDISVEGLQRFKIIAEQSGSTIDAVAGAVFQMGRRLAGGDESAAKAVAELNLNFSELRAMRPEDAFNTVGKALAALDDPMKRSQLGAAIFGRSIDELIPTLKHLSDETTAYVTLTAGQIKVLDALGDAFVNVKNSIIPLTVSMIDNVFMISKMVSAWQSFLGVVNPNEMAVGLDKQASAFARMTAAMKANAEAVSSRALVLGEPAVSPEKAAAELDKAFAALNTRRAASVSITRQVAKAEADLHAELLKIENVLPGVTGHFGRMDDSVTKLGGQLRSLAKDLGDVERHGWTTDGVARALANDLEKLGEHVDPATIHQYAQEWAFTGPILDTVHQKSQAFGQQLDTLAGSLVQLAQVSGDSFGGMVKDIAEIVVAWDIAAKAVDQYRLAVTNSQKAMALAAMGMGFLSATSGGQGKAKGALGGAAAGAQIGMIAGPYGAAVGAAAGFVVGLARNWGGVTAEEKAARQAAQDFADTLAATATTSQRLEAGGEAWKLEVIQVRDAYTAAGLSAAEAEAAVGRLWDATREGGSATAAALAELQRVLDLQQDTIGASGTALTEAAAEASAAVDALAARYKTLNDSVAKEAPEKVMGSIERAARAEMAALERQMDSQAKAMKTDAQEAAAELERALKEMDPAPIHIPIVWDVPRLPFGRTEAPEGTPGEGGGGGGTAVLNVDGRTLAEVIVPHIPGAVRRYGL